MSTRSGLIRVSAVESSPPKTKKGVSPPRSPGRRRKSSPPARSPSRKSPSRKSPSRKPASKFPARKSPSRATKAVTESSAPKSPVKRLPLKTDINTRLDDANTRFESIRTSRRITEYSVKDVSSALVQDDFGGGDRINGVDSLLNSRDIYGLRNRKSNYEAAPRRSSRVREFIENVSDIKRSLSKSVSKSISQSIDTFSDEEQSDYEIKHEKSRSVTRKLATPLRESVVKLNNLAGKSEFSGPLGAAVLMALIPFVVFAILVSCTKSCSIDVLIDVSSYNTATLWLSTFAVSVLTVQHILQGLFVCLPIFGKNAELMDESGKRYCFNAFFASTLTVLLLFAFEFFNIINANTLLNDYLKLSLVSYGFAILLSIILYMKSRNYDDSNLNPYGNTGYMMYDFWIGREIHPYLKRLNVKIWISRICNINTLILAMLILKHGIHLPSNALEYLNSAKYNELLSAVKYKPTILLFTMMQIIYILNYIMKEHKITTTFYWQSEGVGYMQTVASALYPFYFTSISKFVADNDVVLSTNILITASVLYLTGLFLMLASNNIKHEFRKNPLHPSLIHLESMPTFHGKKLLTSNLWGWVRHPNYTGDILIHISLSLPGIISGQYVAASPALFTILVLLHRVWRDHTRCKRRYAAAWQRYCKRVPSAIIPKIL